MTAGQKFTAIDEAAIMALVDAFYAKVRNDPVLAPIFTSVIADDACSSPADVCLLVIGDADLGPLQRKSCRRAPAHREP
jgi:hypothetical protein